VQALLKDSNIDSLLLNFVTPPFVDCEAVAHRLAEIGAKLQKPLVCVVMTIEKWAEVVRLIRESGIPVYDFSESAARVLAAMTEYGRIVAREGPEYPEYDYDKDQAETIISRHRQQAKFLPQAELFELLACYGIPSVKTVRVADEAGLESAARQIGYPAVLKVDAEKIVHKTEAGGVCLNLENETALRAAFDEMVGRFEKHKPGFILQKQLSGGQEVILGVKASEDLSPMIMFGLGGLLVEVLKDVQFRLAPLSRQEALEMIRSIRGRSVLEGARGAEPADIEHLAEILIRLSQLATNFPEIDELDLNPVFAFGKGKGSVVADARLKVKGV
jgi:acetyltransferase